MLKVFLTNICQQLLVCRQEEEGETGAVCIIASQHGIVFFFFMVFLLQLNHNSGAVVLHPRVSVSSQPFRLLGVPAPLIPPPPHPPFFIIFFT